MEFLQVIDQTYNDARKSYPEGWEGCGNVKAISPRAKELVERYKAAHVQIYGGRAPKIEYALSMLIELAMPELGAKLEGMEAAGAQRLANQF